MGSQLRDVDAVYYFQTKINESVISSRIEIVIYTQISKELHMYSTSRIPSDGS
jgi:hypothetical protein